MTTRLPRHELLTEILSIPTAPYREQHVMRFLLGVLTEGKVPHFWDRTGNLVLGAKNSKQYLQKIRAAKASEPLRLFIAHTDHPGFHLEKQLSPGKFEVKFFGGTPTAHGDGAKVWVADDSGLLGHGELSNVTLASHGRAFDRATLTPAFGLELPKKANAVFGGFSFRAPVWEEGTLAYTKAADDLVGCYAIVSTALSIYGDKKRTSERARFAAILTRAEEVGFIGAIGHFEDFYAKGAGAKAGASGSVLAVSLETSRQLPPQAEIGKGPIVRLGDRATVFASGPTRVFSALAQEVLPGAYQRRIMDGGSCEATAATAYGLPAIGISVPLGNYHNQSLEGGPDARPANGPAPEFVDLRDVAGLLKLCDALLRKGLAWTKPWAKTCEGFKKELHSAEGLLRS
jgi:putative aminopeptidase FrvX